MEEQEMVVPDAPPELRADIHPLQLAGYILYYLLHMKDGAVYACWNEAQKEGVWFYSSDKKAFLYQPRVDEVIFTDPVSSRFRGVIFRIACVSDGSELCGLFRLRSDNGQIARRYFVHASFQPKMGAGVWIKVAPIELSEVPSAAPAEVD